MLQQVRRLSTTKLKDFFFTISRRHVACTADRNTAHYINYCQIHGTFFFFYNRSIVVLTYKFAFSEIISPRFRFLEKKQKSHSSKNPY